MDIITFFSVGIRGIHVNNMDTRSLGKLERNSNLKKNATVNESICKLLEYSVDLGVNLQTYPHTKLSYDYNMTLSILRYEQQYSFRVLQPGDMLLATYIVISHGVP